MKHKGIIMKHYRYCLKAFISSVLLTMTVASVSADSNRTVDAVDKGVEFIDESSLLDSFERLQAGGMGVAGAAWIDYDADGDLDLFLPNRAGARNGFFKNLGNGNFIDVTVEAGLDDSNGYAGVVAGDIDNDGYPDLYLGGDGGVFFESSPSRLYHNNGDGTFTDISATSNTPGADVMSSASMADFNNDGLLDIFTSGLGHNGAFVPPTVPSANALYLNNGDLTFTDVSVTAGIDDLINACAVRASDHNNDGWMDIIVAGCLRGFSHIILFENNKDGTFTDIADQVGLSRQYIDGAYMSVSLGDYDNDGDLDLFSTNIGLNSFGDYMPHALLRKNDDGTYTEVSPPEVSNLQFGWGSSFGDWDNDGNIDLFFAGNLPLSGLIGPVDGNPSHLFFNDGSGNLVENSQVLGGNLMNLGSSGVARADYDGDGFLDLVIVTEEFESYNPFTGEFFMRGPGKPVLLKNQGNDNNSAIVRLKGVMSNRMGIGAKLTLYTQGHNGIKKQIREVAAGSSFMSTETPWPTFGMGANKKGLLKVEWPLGKTEMFRVYAGKYRVFEEGKGHEVSPEFEPKTKSIN